MDVELKGLPKSPVLQLGSFFGVRVLVLILGVLASGVTAFAQSQQPERMFCAGVSSWHYSGSYQGYTPPGAGLFIGFRTNKKRYLNSRIELGYGRIGGSSNAFGQSFNNLGTGPTPSFQTDLLYAGLDLNLNLIKRQNFTLYLHAGFGLVRFDVKDGSGAALTNQNSTRALGETYSQTATWIPFGMGMVYWLSQDIGLGLQASFQNPGTQYLDNVNRLGTGQDQVFSLKGSIYFPLAGSAKEATKQAVPSAR